MPLIASSRIFSGLRLEQARKRLFAQTAGEAGVAAIDLLLALQPGQPDLLGVDHDHVIAHIDVRHVLRDSACRSAHWRPSVARRPSVLPLASTTNHLRSISCALGIYVDIALPVLLSIARVNTQMLTQSVSAVENFSADYNVCSREAGAGSNLLGFRVHNPVRQTGTRRLRNQFRIREFEDGVN